MTPFFSSISIWFWQQTTHGNIWTTWLHRQRSRFPSSLLFHKQKYAASTAILLFIYSPRQSYLQYLALNFKTLWINGKWEKSQLVNDDETLPSSGGGSQHNLISLCLRSSLIKNPADRADLKQLMVSGHILQFNQLIFISHTFVSSGASLHQTVWGRAGGFCRLVVQYHRPQSAWDTHPWDSNVR